MFKLGQLKPKAGARHKKMRVGRGTSSGSGKTCGRGHKGQKSRTGGTKGIRFEGGQTPLYRRLPKKRGFKNYLFKKEYAIINLDRLNQLEGEVALQKFYDLGWAEQGDLIKILGKGELNKPLKIEAHKFSKSAKEKIKALGGAAVERS
jgi:large subunit ribosomal protein L15